MYRIIGLYRGMREEVDLAETQEQADVMAREYRMAFGTSWIIWVERKGG